MPLVTTIRERCRVCYTCVRECPAKAIRIAVGQAEVLPERCIGCGNCLRVCSQHAKRVYDSTPDVRDVLESGGKVAAILAPSFPAEFADIEPRRIVGALRALGFDLVCEVAFGADLVAARYRTILKERPDDCFIATTCPAIVAYVERYCPDLVPRLAPIVSPMIACARALRAIHGNELRVVFIGPCIAKKGEIAGDSVHEDVDAALTFVEMRGLLTRACLDPREVDPSDFDPPHAGLGALFPITRGLLQAARLPENLLDGDVVAVQGGGEFIPALREFQTGELKTRLLEVLACDGCIMGPGMSVDTSLFYRRGRVSQYVRERLASMAPGDWFEDMRRFEAIDLRRTFEAQDRRIAAPSTEDVQRILSRMGKTSPEDELNCGACGYSSCREHAVAIFKGLAEAEMCLPYAIDQLRTTIRDLAVSNDQLARTQEALRHSERLASMGQLAAGIAHELNNPLGVVLMFAHILKDEHGQDAELNNDLTIITEEADRCKKIVAGLLHFARQNKVMFRRIDMTELVNRCLAVMEPPEGLRVVVQHEMADRKAEMDPDQITQVLTNLVNNAYAAMPDGGVLTITTAGDDDYVRFVVADTGVGIPKEHADKIFEPFFTTKQLGKGTGLGLAVTYGIVKMHRGDIKVESNADPQAGPTGTTITVNLPRRAERLDKEAMEALIGKTV
ncbi:MAG: 4Fe-4S binding protein [Candidatus Hydrogenedentes bacterium]|nr:4Fe-4S binding protein [Candidatus Hydrogenedentota bacterium]